MTATPSSPLQPTGALEDPAGELGVPQAAMPLFAALGRRWSAHVLFLLGQRPARFTELQHAVPGLSATSLNDRLRDLVEVGLVVRRTFPGPPMSSSYEATELGRLVGDNLIRMVTEVRRSQCGRSSDQAAASP